MDNKTDKRIGGQPKPKLFQRLRRYFLSGLAVIIPIVATIYVVLFAIKGIYFLLGRYIEYILEEFFIGIKLPGFSFLISILLILLIGRMTSFIFTRRTMRFIELWFIRLPLIKNVYPALKKISQYLLVEPEEKQKFSKVVIVPYPHKGCYALAFLSSNALAGRAFNAEGKEFIAAFVPTSPTPWTGFTQFFPKDEVIYPDISVEEALQVIFSGGVVLPDKWVPADGEKYA